MMEVEESTSNWLLNPNFWGTDTSPLMAINQSLERKAKRLWIGRNRNVFDMGRYVIKTPINAGGNDDNSWEGSLGNGERQLLEPLRYVQYPRTRLFYFDEFFILLMEYITPIDWSVSKYEDFPRWVDQVDCGQIGHTSKGRLVVYDYGFN